MYSTGVREAAAHSTAREHFDEPFAMRVPSRFLTLAALAVFVALAAAPSARAEVLPGVIQPTLPPGTAGDDGTDSLTPFEEAVINVGNEILHHNDTIGEEGSDGVRDRTSPPPSPLPPCNLLATQASPLRSIAPPSRLPPSPSQDIADKWAEYPIPWQSVFGFLVCVAVVPVAYLACGPKRPPGELRSDEDYGAV